MRTGRILKAGLLGPLRGVWQRAEEKLEMEVRG